MIADIHIGNHLYGALAYNQGKTDAGLGKILEGNRIFVPADGRFCVWDCMCDFERAMPPQVATTRGIIHISLNPHPEDKLSDEQLAGIWREYMEKLGFGGQPYMIFKHENIDRQHLHIVSIRVRSDGSLISDKKDYKKITDDLEKQLKKAGTYTPFCPLFQMYFHPYSVQKGVFMITVPVKSQRCLSISEHPGVAAVLCTGPT